MRAVRGSKQQQRQQQEADELEHDEQEQDELRHAPQPEDEHAHDYFLQPATVLHDEEHYAHLNII
jgi:hypothetical protein